jgi:hypothetical protein
MIDDWVRVDGLNSAGEDPTLRTIQKRWCPTHRRGEEAPNGKRLRCGAAWAELYGIEKEVEAEKISPIRAILALAENMASLVEEIQYGERIIAEPPPKPQIPPRPPVNPMPPARRNNGKGGVALP